MQNVKNQLVINLSPSTLSVASVHRGKIVQAEKIDLHADQWATLWEEGLIGLDQPFRQLMSRFTSRHPGQATVVYHSPTLIQKVYTFELEESEASRAGVAQLRDSVGKNRPIETYLLSESNDGDVSSTTLVYSEREEQLRSIYAWLNRCDVAAKRLVPSSVAVMTVATQIAKSAPPETAVFYLGDNVSVIAYNCESGLKVIRSTEIGYRALVDGYIQGVFPKSDDPEEEAQQAQGFGDKNKAENILFEHGIPLQSIEVEGVNLRSSVLPLIAPVLQRFCIEIKQTLRFGLGGTEMPKSMVICGPGAAIPHIGAAISQHVDMHIKVDSVAESFLPKKAFGKGTLEWSLCQSESCPAGLLPEVAREAITRQLLSKSLVAGVAIALLAMGGEYAMIARSHQKITHTMSLDSQRAAEVNLYQEHVQDASDMLSVIGEVSGLVVDTVSSIPQWQWTLAQLDSLTPEHVRIHEIRGDLVQGKSIISIHGMANASSEKETGIALNSFVGALEDIESVRLVTLGATSRVSLGDNRWGRQFSLEVELVEQVLPYKMLVDAQANMNPQGAP